MPSVQMVGHTGAYASYIASNHVQILVAYYSAARLEQGTSISSTTRTHASASAGSRYSLFLYLQIFANIFSHESYSIYPTVIYCDNLKLEVIHLHCTCTYDCLTSRHVHGNMLAPSCNALGQAAF